jgi:conjugal transfer mating pair stabilization protein TraG
VDARRAADNLIWEDNGAFDFSSNPVKALARDVGRPFIPQPEEPDARLAVGSPGRDIDVSEWPQTPEEMNRTATKPEGNSTLSFNPKQNIVDQEGEGMKKPDPDAFKRLEKMLKKVDGK